MFLHSEFMRLKMKSKEQSVKVSDILDILLIHFVWNEKETFILVKTITEINLDAFDKKLWNSWKNKNAYSFFLILKLRSKEITLNEIYLQS